jgi:hypothetical protein
VRIGQEIQALPRRFRLTPKPTMLPAWLAADV